MGQMRLWRGVHEYCQAITAALGLCADKYQHTATSDSGLTFTLFQIVYLLDRMANSTIRAVNT